MENTILELVEICHQKELLCMHDNVDDLFESALDFKLLLINCQRLNKEKQEVKNVVDQPAERGNRIIQSLQNFKVIHKSSISLKNTSQISPVHAVAPILSTKEPEYSPSMGYEHPNTTSEMESKEIIKSGVEEIVPILSENEVTSEDKREYAFEDIEYVEASLSDPDIVSVEEEKDVHQEEEEVDLEDISQIQDVDLREKLLSTIRLIANIESLNDNPTPDRMLNSSVSIPIFEESNKDNFLPKFETFCDHTKETRSGNTTTHADDSLPMYDSFYFEIEPDQERLINVLKNDKLDDSSNDPLLEDADLFLASDNLIPSGIENFPYDSERDIRFLEALLIDDSIPINESPDSDFDNPSFPRPPPKPPDAETDEGEEIPVVMNDNDELECLDLRDEFDDENYFSFMFAKVFSFLSAESENTIFDPGISVKSRCLDHFVEIPSGEIKHDQLENSNELFQELFEDLKDLAEYKESLENSSKEIATSNSNQDPPQDSNIRQLIREECGIEVCEEQKQNMENTILELVEICHQKELLCMHDNVDDLIESSLDFKLLLINSQRLNKEKQEVKNVVEQPAERGNRIIQSLQNFRVIHKSSISLKSTSQISLVHAVAPILSTKEPKYLPSMGYEHPDTTSEMESKEIIKSGVEELVPILSENEVTSEDKRECDVSISENSPICDDHSEIFSDSNNDDDILSDEDAFEDIEYVEASLSDPEIVSVEEENDVHQEEKEVDLEDISQIQDVNLREKLLSITRLIANIKSLNENPTPDLVLNSFVLIPIFEESNKDNFSPKFETFCNHTEETRSGNTTNHVDESLPMYDSFYFEIEPDQERLINVLKNDILDDSSNDPLLEEADLFLASDNLIPLGIENFPYDSEGDIRFLEALLIDDSIPINESNDSDFDNPSFPRPPPEPPDAETDEGEEILVVMNDNDELECLDPRDEFDDENYFSFMFTKVFSFLSADSADTIFDPGISV
uniref:Reverse transcriptase domain-containing protein n=1 Tax=Tanacetum cinerariifolium TaxID=118510 RepID=A0A6L2K6A8_TANCI|nr:hypothetical protein [Tanacetum cinerariifolium]